MERLQEILCVLMDYSYKRRTGFNTQKYADYSYPIQCTDGESVWVNKDGWMHPSKSSASRDTIKEFIDAVNSSNLGIKITETIV